VQEVDAQLNRWIRADMAGLPDFERSAALLAVGDIFDLVDLSDAALFAVDVDAGRLAERLRREGRGCIQDSSPGGSSPQIRCPGNGVRLPSSAIRVLIPSLGGPGRYDRWVTERSCPGVPPSTRSGRPLLMGGLGRRANKLL
jgi:hypothetical protein